MIQVSDPALKPIAEKVERGERLSREDGLVLYASDDLLGIGAMADHVRDVKNGDRVYFMVNRHINPTNICLNRCKFCAFSRNKGQDGAYEMTLEEIVKAAEEAGLDAMPGGGAEIFSERTRQAAWDKKTSADDWLRIHGEAHSLGIKTNCTMLYGHIETLEERVDHLIRLREQQDESGGFLAFIPLAFHPLNTELSQLPGTTGFDDLKTLAIARLMLDNIPHVKAFWIMLGLKVAQLSTVFGVDDLDGTVVEEKITHMAGAATPEALSKDELVSMIAETGHVPVERDTLYNVVKVYDEEC